MIVPALVGTSFVVTELSASVDVAIVWVVDAPEPRLVALAGGSDTVVPEKRKFCQKFSYYYCIYVCYHGYGQQTSF